MKKTFLITSFIALWTAFVLPAAHAVILDWDTVTWTPGSLVQSYDIDPSFAGNDIRITIGGDIGNLINGTPRLNNDLTGGISPAEMALRLQLNLPNRTNFVTVTIDFLNPVGVLLPTFSLFDIDTGTGSSPNFSFQDQIRNIQATFGPTSYSPTITGLGSTVSQSGSTLTGIGSAANNTSNGSAMISFTSGPVTQIRFDYGGGPNSLANPATQGIALSDISFNNISGVPEINAIWVAIVALLLAALVRTLRQNQADRLVARPAVE